MILNDKNINNKSKNKLGDKMKNKTVKNLQDGKKKFIIYGYRWFDKINGNTYHVIEIFDNKGELLYVSPYMVYGYGDQYRTTALKQLAKMKKIPKKYSSKTESGSDRLYLYERENNYPIMWHITDVKRKKDLPIKRDGLSDNSMSRIIKFLKENATINIGLNVDNMEWNTQDEMDKYATKILKDYIDFANEYYEKEGWKYINVYDNSGHYSASFDTVDFLLNKSDLKKFNKQFNDFDLEEYSHEFTNDELPKMSQKYFSSDRYYKLIGLNGLSDKSGKKYYRISVDNSDYKFGEYETACPNIFKKYFKIEKQANFNNKLGDKTKKQRKFKKYSKTMNDFVRAFEVSYLGPSYSKGSRVKIRDLRFNKTLILGSTYQDVAWKQAEKYLNEHGIKIKDVAEGEHGKMYLLSDDFETQLKEKKSGKKSTLKDCNISEDGTKDFCPGDTPASVVDKPEEKATVADNYRTFQVWEQYGKVHIKDLYYDYRTKPIPFSNEPGSPNPAIDTAKNYLKKFKITIEHTSVDRSKSTKNDSGARYYLLLSKNFNQQIDDKFIENELQDKKKPRRRTRKTTMKDATLNDNVFSSIKKAILNDPILKWFK